MSDKILRIFLSRKFAVTLLVITVAFLVVGTSLPDVAAMTAGEAEAFRAASPALFHLSAALQMQNLISSPLFLLMPFLIFLSTTVCTLKRLWRRSVKEGGFHYERSGTVQAGSERAVALLSAARWSVTRRDSLITAAKGGFGFWGSILFHAGLLAILVAVTVSALTQFNAELLLTEGFPVTLGPDAFVKVHKKNGLASLPPAVLELKRFVPRYERDRFATDFSAQLLIDGSPKDIHVNKPVDIDGFQLSLHRFGFSPSFRITDRSGKEIVNANVNLVIVGGAEDSFRIPDTGYTIHTRFFPDFSADGGRYGSRGPLPRNPVLLLSVSSGDRQTDWRAVPLGQTVMIGDLHVGFSGLSYWIDLIVGRDYGIWILAAGLSAGVLGLAVRFGAPHKELAVRFEGNTVYLTGWTKYFPAFFQAEMDELLKMLEEQEYNRAP